MGALQDEIVALALRGKPPLVIEEEMEGRVTRYQIYNAVAAARGHGVRIPSFKTSGGHSGKNTVVFDKSLLAKFDEPAAKRGINRNELIRQLIETLGEEQTLIANVLDDGVA